MVLGIYDTSISYVSYWAQFKICYFWTHDIICIFLTSGFQVFHSLGGGNGSGMGALLISDRRGVPWSDDARFFYFSLSYVLCMLWMWSRMGTHSYLKDQRGVPSSDDAHFFFLFFLQLPVPWCIHFVMQSALNFYVFVRCCDCCPAVPSLLSSQDRIRSGPGRSGPRGSIHSWARSVLI